MLTLQVPSGVHPAYRSTRGGEPGTPFGKALLQGLAADGGLFVPETVPPWPEEPAATFPELGRVVLNRWLGHLIPEDTLALLLSDALSFPVPLVPLEGRGWEGVYVLELFHGPTLSFKDFGARTMARLMAHQLREQDQALTILVATSGDTGSAVADGFAGQEHIQVVLLYPRGQVSPTQERQLIVERPGVRAFAVEGVFDDCQRMVKEAFTDPALTDLPLSSANSINIGRLLPQMLYYGWAGRQLGQMEAVYCVPSGNLGNLTAGVLAAGSGLPTRGFIAAHNANDFFPRVLAGEEATYRATRPTLSNAMDVGVPSNYERLRTLLDAKTLRSSIWGTSVDDATTLETIRTVHEQTGYLPDPHTAVGLEAVRRYRQATGDEAPVVVLSTAHPSKFPEIIERALGFSPEMPERLASLWDQPVRVRTIPPTLDALKAALLANA